MEQKAEIKLSSVFFPEVTVNLCLTLISLSARNKVKQVHSAPVKVRLDGAIL